VNAKEFYSLLCSIALRTISISTLNIKLGIRHSDRERRKHTYLLLICSLKLVLCGLRVKFRVVEWNLVVRVHVCSVAVNYKFALYALFGLFEDLLFLCGS